MAKQLPITSFTSSATSASTSSSPTNPSSTETVAKPISGASTSYAPGQAKPAFYDANVCSQDEAFKIARKRGREAAKDVIVTRSGPVNENSKYLEREVIAGLTLFEIHRPPRDQVQDDRFIEVECRSLNADLTCPVCLGILHDTMVVMECLHRFCQGCITKSLRLGRRECPSCREKVPSKRSLRADPNFDALIAKVYPNLDEYEAKEAKLIEEINRKGARKNFLAQTRQRKKEAQERKRKRAMMDEQNSAVKSKGKSRKAKLNGSSVGGPSGDNNDGSGGSQYNATILQAGSASNGSKHAGNLVIAPKIPQNMANAYLLGRAGFNNKNKGLSIQRPIIPNVKLEKVIRNGKDASGSTIQGRKLDVFDFNEIDGAQSPDSGDNEDSWMITGHRGRKYLQFVLKRHPLETMVKNLDAEYLRTLPRLKISALVKYVERKLRIFSHKFRIIVTERAGAAVQLDGQLSLIDTFQRFWKGKDGIMVLHYMTEKGKEAMAAT